MDVRHRELVRKLTKTKCQRVGEFIYFNYVTVTIDIKPSLFGNYVPQEVLSVLFYITFTTLSNKPQLMNVSTKNKFWLKRDT